MISGLLIASFGMAPSFFINAISFGLVVLVLMILDVTRLHVTAPAERKPGQVREGLSYIRQVRVLVLVVTVMSVVFVAAYNFQILVPLLTFRMLGGSSELYGVVMSFLAGGRGRFLADSFMGETGRDDDRRMVRVAEHRSYLADFAVRGSFRVGGHVFAGCSRAVFSTLRSPAPCNSGRAMMCAAV